MKNYLNKKCAILHKIFFAVTFIFYGCNSKNMHETTFRLAGESTIVIASLHAEFLRNGFSENNGLWVKNDSSIQILEVDHVENNPELTEIKIRSKNYDINNLISNISEGKK